MIIMIKEIFCKIFGHKYVVLRKFSPTSRQIGCIRCAHKWGMNDSTQSFIDWDEELKQMYMDIGQWSGRKISTGNSSKLRA